MYFVNNRQVINRLAIDTSSSDTPSYVDLCCATERTLNVNIEEQDFAVFCDALRRHVTTGADVQIATTIKIDAQNTGVLKLLGNIHTLITSGTISQFNNVKIQFGLLSGYTTNTLQYTTYNAIANIQIEALGGSAEDVSEVGVTFTLNGTASPSASV